MSKYLKEIQPGLWILDIDQEKSNSNETSNIDDIRDSFLSVKELLNRIRKAEKENTKV